MPSLLAHLLFKSQLFDHQLVVFLNQCSPVLNQRFAQRIEFHHQTEALLATTNSLAARICLLIDIRVSLCFPAFLYCIEHVIKIILLCCWLQGRSSCIWLASLIYGWHIYFWDFTCRLLHLFVHVVRVCFWPYCGEHCHSVMIDKIRSSWLACAIACRESRQECLLLRILTTHRLIVFQVRALLPILCLNNRKLHLVCYWLDRLFSNNV